MPPQDAQLITMPSLQSAGWLAYHGHNDEFYVLMPSNFQVYNLQAVRQQLSSMHPAQLATLLVSSHGCGARNL